MSGGGSGGGDFPAPGREIACEDLTFETHLASPQPEIAALALNEVLDIDLREDNDVRLIAALRKSGVLVGSISSHVAELLRCIQQGVTFEAEVLAIQDGAVRVRVYAT